LSDGACAAGAAPSSRRNPLPEETLMAERRYAPRRMGRDPDTDFA
jgi:hypothetical protein